MFLRIEAFVRMQDDTLLLMKSDGSGQPSLATVQSTGEERLFPQVAMSESMCVRAFRSPWHHSRILPFCVGCYPRHPVGKAEKWDGLEDCPN
jgi:hypothetical protein